MKIGFLGLGTMGAPMAANLRRRGHELVVWNRTRERAEEFVAAQHAYAAMQQAAPGPSLQVAGSPADAARGAELVITMLTDPRALLNVFKGPEGVLVALTPGTTVVDMSTVDPATVIWLDNAVRARRCVFIDAPVSGTKKPAVEGRLLIMAGGDEFDVDRARPALEALGTVLYVGPVGAGSSMKLVLNALGAHMITGLASSLVLAKKLGLDPKLALDVIEEGAFTSPLFESKGKRMLERDFTPDFRLVLLLKDVELVLRTGGDAGVDMPTLERIRDVLLDAVAVGLGELDMSGLVQLLERAVGMRLNGERW